MSLLSFFSTPPITSFEQLELEKGKIQLTIMKMAARRWHSVLKSLEAPFLFVNDVHDEWQTETTPEFAGIVGRTQAASITEVGAELGLNCKLSGEYKTGKNWRETH